MRGPLICMLSLALVGCATRPSPTDLELVGNSVQPWRGVLTRERLTLTGGGRTHLEINNPGFPCAPDARACLFGTLGQAAT